MNKKETIKQIFLEGKKDKRAEEREYNKRNYNATTKQYHRELVEKGYVYLGGGRTGHADQTQLEHKYLHPNKKEIVTHVVDGTGHKMTKQTIKQHP